MIYKIDDVVKFIREDGTDMLGVVTDVDQVKRMLEVVALGKTYNIPEENAVLHFPDFSINASDMVNHPKHYSNKPDGIETIQIVDHMVLGLKPRAAVRIGNATKYMDRFMSKNGVEDLKKAIWYLQDYVNHYEEYNK